MAHIINEVEFYKKRPNNNPELNIIQDLFSDFDEDQVFLTSSAKAALDIILSYYREIGFLFDKNSEVWVPKWMSSWVYNTMQKRCFPSIVPSESTKGILIYHQYGYPQNMSQLIGKAKENNWFIIEDCAHALWSYYNNKRLGLFGDVGIFSLSKFFPSLMGGVITTKNKGLSEYINKRFIETKNWGGRISFLSKLAHERSTSRYTKSFWGKLVEMSYNISDSNLLINQKSQNAIKYCLHKKVLDKRKENWDYFKEQLGKIAILPEVENHETVLPYVVPLFGDDNILMNIISSLKKINVKTGIYHFDINRNMANPEFVKCVWLPIHEGINEKIRKQIIENIGHLVSEY